MRLLIVVAVLPILAAAPAKADAPNSIVSMIGPAVGYLLGQSDLCDWNLSDKIEKTYQKSFTAIGMSPAQQAAAWDAAKIRRSAIGGMPAEGRVRMKADTCTPEFRARFEKDITD